MGYWFWTDDFLWLEAAASPDLFHALREALTFPRGATPYWRPLVDLHFFAMYRVFSLNATAYHVANLALHVSSGAFLGLFALRLTRSAAAAALAGSLFVISPAYSAMVPWAAGATAMLSGFFSIATLLMFLAWLQEGRGYKWLALPATTFAAALLAKEDAASLPPVLALCALLAHPPRRLSQLRTVALVLMPFLGIWTLYVLPQLLLVVRSAQTTTYSITWHAVPRLIDTLVWMSFPWPLWYADWVSPARWAVFCAFTLVAAAALTRRQPLLPMLYGATVLMLLPSSFFTAAFAPRWTYLASLPWAIFVALLLTRSYERLTEFNRPLGLVTAATVGSAVLFFLASRTLDSQSWVSPLAKEYQETERTVQTNCGDHTAESSVYLLELPVPDSAYTVPSLVRLRLPHAVVYDVSRHALLDMPPPKRGDCVVYWADGPGYATQAFHEGSEGYDFWVPKGSENLLGSGTDDPDMWLPFQSHVQAEGSDIKVSSVERDYGASIGEVPLVRGDTYVASIWVKGLDVSPGDRVRVFLDQQNGAAVKAPALSIPLSGQWQRVAVLSTMAGRQPEAARLHVVRLGVTGRASGLLLRDPEVTLFAPRPSPS